MSNECFTEKKKGKEDADISSSRDFWTTRQLKDYLRKQGASSGEENVGWSRGKVSQSHLLPISPPQHDTTGPRHRAFLWRVSGFLLHKAKGLMPSTTYDRSISIVTRWRAKVFFFFFFVTSLTKLFFYSYFFLRVMFLFGKPKRSSTAEVSSETNATLGRFPPSLASLNFLASRSLGPQMNTLPRKTLLFLELLLALRT